MSEIINLDDLTKFKLSEIDKIKDYFKISKQKSQ